MQPLGMRLQPGTWHSSLQPEDGQSQLGDAQPSQAADASQADQQWLLDDPFNFAPEPQQRPSHTGTMRSSESGMSGSTA